VRELGPPTTARISSEMAVTPSRPRRGCYLGVIPISASSRMAVSVARPLSVSVYAPLSRLCTMNPRMAMECIARNRLGVPYLRTTGNMAGCAIERAAITA